MNKMENKKKNEGMVTRMQDPKYHNQVYKEDSIVNMSGKVFTSIIKTENERVAVLSAFKESLKSYMEATEIQIQSARGHIEVLSKMHMDNVDNGLTYTKEVKQETVKNS